MYKNAWCTCEGVVLRNKPIAFLTSSPLPSPSSLLKLPNFSLTATAKFGGSLVSPCPPECYLQRETKIELDLRL